MPEHESRASVAVRGLFWGAIIGGFLGYVGADEGDYKSLSPKLSGALGGIMIGAPLGMILWLVITPV